MGEAAQSSAKNAISVDVEEYFHASNLDPYVGRNRWKDMPSRVEEAVKRTLALFDMHNTKATFFVLGVVAKQHPHLVKAIAEGGHEVGSHGWDHRLAYEQSPAEFLADISRTKKLLEDLTGVEVKGYRAPNFSIVESNDWAFDELIAAGYTYDSSTYPVWHPRYANLGKNRSPYVLKRESGSLIEVPLATSQFSLLGKDLTFPIAGGAYWRLFPSSLIRAALRRRNTKEGSGNCCYFHPWELDTEQPLVITGAPLTRMRHHGGTAKFEKKISRFLKEFDFGTIWQLIESLKKRSNQPVP